MGAASLEPILKLHPAQGHVHAHQAAPNAQLGRLDCVLSASVVKRAYANDPQRTSRAGCRGRGRLATCCGRRP